MPRLRPQRKQFSGNGVRAAAAGGMGRNVAPGGQEVGPSRGRGFGRGGPQGRMLGRGAPTPDMEPRPMVGPMPGRKLATGSGQAERPTIEAPIPEIGPVPRGVQDAGAGAGGKLASGTGMPRPAAGPMPVAGAVEPGAGATAQGLQARMQAQMGGGPPGIRPMGPGQAGVAPIRNRSLMASRMGPRKKPGRGGRFYTGA
jgi:hypothetical protein